MSPLFTDIAYFLINFVMPHCSVNDADLSIKAARDKCDCLLIAAIN